MTALPAGWTTTTLASVCRIVSGATPKTGIAKYWGDDIAWLTPADMSRDRSQVLSRGARGLSALGYDSCSAQIVPKGSVVVSSRAPVGYVAIAGAPLATNQGCKTAVLPESLDSRYVYWYLIHARPDLERRASGTTFKEISAKEFGRTVVTYPPLDEQRRIVDILEDHLSRLDAAEKSLLAAERSTSTFKSQVLDQLMWSEVAATITVGKVLAEPMRNGHSAPATKSTEGVRTLTLTAVTKGRFSDEYTKVTSADPARVRGLWLEPGDVLVQRSNTPELVGTTAMYAGSRDWAIFPDLLIRLRSDPTIMRPDYLALALSSERAHRELRGKAKGLAGSMPKIDQAAIGSTVIPLLPLEAQEAVIREAKQRQDSIDLLRGAIQDVRRRASLLRRALLAAAFSGRLTGLSSDLERAEELVL